MFVDGSWEDLPEGGVRPDHFAPERGSWFAMAKDDIPKLRERMLQAQANPSLAGVSMHGVLDPATGTVRTQTWGPVKSGVPKEESLQQKPRTNESDMPGFALKGLDIMEKIGSLPLPLPMPLLGAKYGTKIAGHLVARMVAAGDREEDGVSMSEGLGRYAVGSGRPVTTSIKSLPSDVPVENEPKFRAEFAKMQPGEKKDVEFSSIFGGAYDPLGKSTQHYKLHIRKTDATHGETNGERRVGSQLYNFDAKPRGTRSDTAEILTRSAHILLGNFLGGKPYTVNVEGADEINKKFQYYSGGAVKKEKK